MYILLALILFNLYCIYEKILFPSIDKIPRIRSQTLIIHGTEDEVIDFSHGVALYQRCHNPVEPLWVEGAGHNDVELYGQYLERIRKFINQVRLF